MPDTHYQWKLQDLYYAAKERAERNENLAKLVIDLYRARAKRAQLNRCSHREEPARSEYLAASRAAATALRRVIAEGERLDRMGGK